MGKKKDRGYYENKLKELDLIDKINKARAELKKHRGK